MAKQNNIHSAQELTAFEGQVPPQATDLEEAVLGAVMLDTDAFAITSELLSAEMFYVPSHRTIYESCEELFTQGKPIDMLTVSDTLRRKKKLNEIGGAAFLAQLTQKVGSAMNIEFHSSIIAQKYVQRELISSATRIQRESYDEDKDVAELLNVAEEEIFGVSAKSKRIRRDIQTTASILAKTMKDIEEAQSKGEAVNGVPSGFVDMDRITMGWQPSDLIIVAARPSMGKTAFVLSMARNIAVDHDKAVAFFSLEMSSQQLMMRLVVSESELNSRDIRTGRLTNDQWRHLERSIQPLSRAQLYIDDTPALSIAEFRSKVRKLKTQHNVELIVIDYLQLMTASAGNKNSNREQEVALISRSLKGIAKELNVPIIALSQLNRSIESSATGNRRPQLSNLRESGSIEQDADIVAFIHRPEYYGLTQDADGNSTAGLAEIILAKHRNGPTETIKLRFRSEFARFSNWDSFRTMDSAMNDDLAGAGAAEFELPTGDRRGARMATNETDEAPF